MDDFEHRLRELPLRQPPEGLRQRIFDPMPAAPPHRRNLLARRIPLAWAAVLVLTAGLGGFSLAHLTRPGPVGPALAPRSVTSVQVRLVERPPQRHVFDFTASPASLLPGDCQVRIISPGEV